MVSHVWLCSFTHLIWVLLSFTPVYQAPKSKVVELRYNQTSDEKNSPTHPKNETINLIITDTCQLNPTCKCWRLSPSSPSLRAQFAVENEPMNQLHGSASHEEAEQEINFFFPKQQTLAVIKPDAMEEHRGPLLSFRGIRQMWFTCFVEICSANITTFAPTGTILGEIRSSGFSVTRLKEMVLSRQMAEEFYKEHREKAFFSQLVEFMCRLVYPWTQPEMKGEVSTADLPQFPFQVLTALLTAILTA